MYPVVAAQCVLPFTAAQNQSLTSIPVIEHPMVDIGAGAQFSLNQYISFLYAF